MLDFSFLLRWLVSIYIVKLDVFKSETLPTPFSLVALNIGLCGVSLHCSVYNKAPTYLILRSGSTISSECLVWRLPNLI